MNPNTRIVRLRRERGGAVFNCLVTMFVLLMLALSLSSRMFATGVMTSQSVDAIWDTVQAERVAQSALYQFAAPFRAEVTEDTQTLLAQLEGGASRGEHSLFAPQMAGATYPTYTYDYRYDPGESATVTVTVSLAKAPETRSAAGLSGEAAGYALTTYTYAVMARAVGECEGRRAAKVAYGELVVATAVIPRDSGPGTSIGAMTLPDLGGIANRSAVGSGSGGDTQARAISSMSWQAVGVPMPVFGPSPGGGGPGPYQGEPEMVGNWQPVGFSGAGSGGNATYYAYVKGVAPGSQGVGPDPGDPVPANVKVLATDDWRFSSSYDQSRDQMWNGTAWVTGTPQYAVVAIQAPPVEGQMSAGAGAQLQGKVFGMRIQPGGTSFPATSTLPAVPDRAWQAEKSSVGRDGAGNEIFISGRPSAGGGNGVSILTGEGPNTSVGIRELSGTESTFPAIQVPAGYPHPPGTMISVGGVAGRRGTMELSYGGVTYTVTNADYSVRSQTTNTSIFTPPDDPGTLQAFAVYFHVQSYSSLVGEDLSSRSE